MSQAAVRVTPMGVAVLALLREGEMHPYEMLRLLRHRRYDRLVALSNGTLYHTVDRLDRTGLIAEVGVDRDGNRPERTSYRVTEAGREAMDRWIRAELARIDHPAEFRIALAECNNIPRDEVIALLAERRAALAAELEVHLEGRRKASALGVLEQFLLEFERQTLLLDAELRWIDDLIRRLDTKSFAWGIDELDAATLTRIQDHRKATLS